jgi:hypothetical protein
MSIIYLLRKEEKNGRESVFITECEYCGFSESSAPEHVNEKAKPTGKHTECGNSALDENPAFVQVHEEKKPTGKHTECGNCALSESSATVRVSVPESIIPHAFIDAVLRLIY